MEVKLEDLMKAKQGLATADVTPDNLPSAEVMTAQVEKVVNDLTPEERSKVDKIKDELDLTDSTAILRFGAENRGVFRQRFIAGTHERQRPCRRTAVQSGDAGTGV